MATNSDARVATVCTWCSCPAPLHAFCCPHLVLPPSLPIPDRAGDDDFDDRDPEELEVDVYFETGIEPNGYLAERGAGDLFGNEDEWRRAL